MTATATALAIHFEFEDCTRCGGSGHYSFNQMEGTRCRRCRGRQRTITRRGSNAYTRWKEQIEERLSVPVVDLQPGDVVYSDAERMSGFQPIFYPTRWRTVVRVDREELGTSTNVTVVFASQDPDGRHVSRCMPTDQVDAFTVPRRDRPVLEEINRAVTRRFKGAWLTGEEPPAPAARRVRTPKTSQERRATVDQLRMLDKHAADLDAGPLTQEAAAFAAAPGTFAEAYDLIEKVTAALAEQRQQRLDRQAFAGAIDERVAVTGTVVRRRSGDWGVLLVVRDERADKDVQALAFLQDATARAVREGERITLAGKVSAHQMGWDGQTKETKLSWARVTQH